MTVQGGADLIWRPACRPLTKKELCALLPLSTGIVVFWFWVFLVVELAGGAGGSSGVAGTRTVKVNSRTNPSTYPHTKDKLTDLCGN